MDIKPCIIGPDLSINSDIIICMVDEIGIPIPGIIGGSWETVILFGESREIALGIDYCRSLMLKGKTGSSVADIKATSKGERLNLKGSYAGLYGSYYIYPIEGGYWIKGTNGKSNMDIRITTSGTFSKVMGLVNNVKNELSIKMMGDNLIMLKGNEGKNLIEVNISYVDEGIKVKGKNGPHFLDYMITSGEDRITVKGITKDGFIEYHMILESETEIKVIGKPGKVPVDYLITLYENGAAVKGNTGYYKGDYALVLGEGETSEEEYKGEE